MKIAIFPQSKNPYMRLLYDQIRLQHPDDTVTHIAASPLTILTFPLLPFLLRLRGYRIFHLHWLVFFINGRHRILFQRQISLLYTFVCLTSIKLAGLKLVWTVHNVLPHEPQTSNDRVVAQYLSKIADAKIVHTHFSLTQMAEHDLDTDRTTVIPHGNYIGAYPKPTINRIQLRKQLTIPENAYVFLFFGLIRPYKGIEKLISAFKKRKAEKAHLLIVGKCDDTSFRTKLMEHIANHPNITLVEGYIANEAVTGYFALSDIVCLPFENITTSGSALLALSLAKPIIAPRIGALTEFPATVGYLYEQNDHGLDDALDKALLEHTNLALMSADALSYAKSLSWDTIASKTHELYLRL